MQEFFDKNNKDLIQWVFSQWKIKFKCVRSNFDIQGSPERTLSRVVIEDINGSLFLFEKFSKSRFQLRNDIAKAIEYLNINGLKQALFCQKTLQGEFLPFYKDNCFAISPFLDGTKLKRPDYLESATIGKNFALFLIDLSKASKNIKPGLSLQSFHIDKYVYQLFDTMKKHDSGIYDKYLPFLKFLERNKSFSGFERLPRRFSHGDLHPLNVIWEQDCIKAVIDWEFTGFKPDIFDAANLVGCAGIENPQGLTMPMVVTFIENLKNADIISCQGWKVFIEYIIALRFAWVSEWLRKKDKQMLTMEACYLDILIKNIDALKHIWEIK